MAKTEGLIRKYQNAAFRLQREAYEIQIAKLPYGKQLKHFNPCPKGLIFSAELGKEDMRVLIQVEREVILTACECHHSMTIQQLVEYEYDDTFNHYARRTERTKRQCYTQS